MALSDQEKRELAKGLKGRKARRRRSYDKDNGFLRFVDDLLGSAQRDISAIPDMLSQGLTGGFADEIAGISPFKTIKDERERLKEQRKESPIVSILSEAAGSLAPFGTIGKAVSAAKGIKNLSAAKRSALEGALGGSIYAAGASDADTLSGRLGAATSGAVLGAGFGERSQDSSILKRIMTSKIFNYVD